MSPRHAGDSLPLEKKTRDSELDPGARDKLNCLHSSDFYVKQIFFESIFLLQVKSLPEMGTRSTNPRFCLILVFVFFLFFFFKNWVELQRDSRQQVAD